MSYEFPSDDTGTEARVRRDYLTDALDYGITTEALMAHSQAVSFTEDPKGLSAVDPELAEELGRYIISDMERPDAA